MLGSCRRVWEGWTLRFFEGQKPAVRVSQEDQPHDRQKILVAGVVGVSPQCVRRFPEPFFDGFNMFKLCHCYLSNSPSMIMSEAIVLLSSDKVSDH